MKKFLFLTSLFLGFLLNSGLANAQPLTIDESLEAVCRVSARNARGSGIVFAQDEDKFYVLTNGHVVGRASRGHVEFFQDGYKSSMIPYKTEYAAYKDGTALDLAVLSIKKKYFGRYPPRVIPLAPRGTVIKPNDLVMAGGCPSAQWACAWKGRVIRNGGATVSFNAAPLGGQSGSGVLILIKDKDGETQTRLGILLAWRIGDGAYTDDGEDDYGAGLSLKQIYEILDGNGKEHPIESSYKVISEKVDEPTVGTGEKNSDNHKAEKKNPKPKRLTDRCPHCDLKIEDHVIIPHKGGLKRDKGGFFMFCPQVKFPDGSYADTARYYGGIKVGELYDGSGLFPWCPLVPYSPPKPPKPEPPNGGGDGGGFNPWPGRPTPGGPVDPPTNFEKERQEFLDKITELQEKLSNLEALSESLKAELSGTNSNLLNSEDEIRGLRDLLGKVEGQKQSLGSRIEQLLGFVHDKDQVISNLKEEGAHYLDGATGGNGNTVENVSFTLGGASLGMLALKYGVPFLLNRRRKRKQKKEEEEPEDDGYDIGDVGDGNIPEIPAGDCQHQDNEEDETTKHVHEHEHIHTHKHKHENDFIMPPEDLPDPRTTHEIDELAKQGYRAQLNPGFAGYGLPMPPIVNQYHYPQAVAAHGLPPQLPNIPFSTRKNATAEQIMTIFGELMNEYQDDQSMTMAQMDILLRQRLKEKHNIE